MCLILCGFPCRHAFLNPTALLQQQNEQLQIALARVQAAIPAQIVVPAQIAVTNVSLSSMDEDHAINQRHQNSLMEMLPKEMHEVIT